MRWFIIKKLNIFLKIKNKYRQFKCKYDLHDYKDDKDFSYPAHFYEYTCQYCGKKFYI